MDIDCPNSLKRCSSAPMINNILQPVQSAPQMASTAQQQSSVTSSGQMVRDAAPPTSIFNILGTRARRHSGSFSPLSSANGSPGGPRLIARVSQLRQEECADISNSREVNHEREIHSAIQMSQSCEDLTICAENWSCNDAMTSQLHVTLPIGPPICSSPSPTRNGIRCLYGMSPSPTRKTFQTRRSMSPIPLRPSSLSGVKRKCEMDDCGYSHSPPPFKKAFTERGPSPSICQTPSPICPSPDSYEGRTTPKLFPCKFNSYTINTNSSSSICSSPLAPSMMDVTVELISAQPVPNQLDTVIESEMNDGDDDDDEDDDDDDDVAKIQQKNNSTDIKHAFLSVTANAGNNSDNNRYNNNKSDSNRHNNNNNNNDDTLLRVITSSSSSPSPSPAAAFESSSSENSSNVSSLQTSQDVVDNKNTNNLNMSVITTV